MGIEKGMEFDCIFEEPLEFIDIKYTHLNKTIRYEKRPHGEWNGKAEDRIVTTRYCTSCGVRGVVGNFCMWCGADMRKEKQGNV